jgi:hypothetical protein
VLRTEKPLFIFFSSLLFLSFVSENINLFIQMYSQLTS